MGHDGAASGYPTPTGFRRLTGCQRDPQDIGVSHIKPSLSLGPIVMLLSPHLGPTATSLRVSSRGMLGPGWARAPSKKKLVKYIYYILV